MQKVDDIPLEMFVPDGLGEGLFVGVPVGANEGFTEGMFDGFVWVGMKVGSSQYQVLYVERIKTLWLLPVNSEKQSYHPRLVTL